MDIKKEAAIVPSILLLSILLSIVYKKVKHKTQEQTNEYKKNFLILNEWISSKQKGISVLDFFSIHGYKRIMLVGESALTNRFYQELLNEKYEVIKKNRETYKSVNLEQADVIVWEHQEYENSFIPAVTIENIILGTEE